MKFLPIKIEDIKGKFDLNINIKDTVKFQQVWIEIKGKKYYCSKIGNGEWQITKLKEFPFVKLPDDFKLII